MRVSDGVYEGELHGVSGMADGSVRVTVSQREAAWNPEGGTGGPPNLVESEEQAVRFNSFHDCTASIRITVHEEDIFVVEY